MRRDEPRAPARAAQRRRGVVEQHALVADPADARLEAGRRLAALDPRVAADALLGLALRPGVERLLARARRHAHPPPAAGLAVDEHDPVLAALVDRAGRAGRGAGGVEAVVARARQVEEDEPLERQQRLRSAGSSAARLGSAAAWMSEPARSSSQFGPALGSMGLPVIAETGARRQVVRGLGREQVLVAVGPRLVLIVEGGQPRRLEQVLEDAPPRPPMRAELAALDHEAAAVALLILPQRRLPVPGRVSTL